VRSQVVLQRAAVEKVITATLEEPAGADTHWSIPSMASPIGATGVSVK
jgi:hypothetical protein